jgi:hypothetical protein
VSRFRKFLRLSSADRSLAIEAFLWLGIARISVLTIPFRWLAPRLGIRQTADEPHTTMEPASPEVLRVAGIIQRVSGHTPWSSNCLAQAIAGQQMLKRRAIPSSMYFGVAKNQHGALEAHAWLRSGAKTVTGGEGVCRYAVVARFVDNCRP